MSTSSPAARHVTLVVHGTYAAEETWWLPGGAGRASFADDIERALAARGVAGTVWTPVVEAGMDPRAFGWSGANTHAARVAGGRNLVERLTELADKLKATPDDPLVVHFVAHSHGGNVVLEAMRRLPSNVSCGEIVLLGTPLLRATPVLRPFRFVFGLSVLGIVLTLVTIAFVMALDFHHGEKVRAAAFVLAVVPITSGWIFLGIAKLVDVLWALPARFLRAATGRHGGPCYGPGSRKLRQALRGRKALLLSSRYDEASLIVDLSCAPYELYDAHVRKQRGLSRFFHRTVLRPLVYGAFDAVECVLERAVLGFPLHHVLFFDYGLARLSPHGAYSQSVLERHDVTRDLQRLAAAQAVASPVSIGMSASQEIRFAADEDAGRVDLGENLEEVRRYFQAQIALRHSLYHDSPQIVARVAERIAGGATSAR